MLLQSYRIPKATQTYADTLVAIGMADLFSTWLEEEGMVIREVIIKDENDAYELLLNPAIDLEKARSVKLLPGYPYIKYKKNDSAPYGIEVIDYELEREKEAIYRDFDKIIKKTSKNKKTQIIPKEKRPDPPRNDIQLLKDFNSLRMGSNGYNSLLLILLEREDIAEIVAKRIKKISNQDLEKGLSAANLQLFSPISGKGVHRSKPDGVGLGGLSDQVVDWFDEWMKYRAMHIAMSSYRVGEDTKILVMAPGEINISALKLVREELLKQSLWGSLRLEINAVLGIAEILIVNSEVLAGSEGRIKIRQRRPQEIIKGISTAYFKSLGTGKALMNVSFLGLPGWFPVNTRDDAEAWLDIISEHRQCINTLNEEHSGDIPLLQEYRNFVSSGSLNDFLMFTTDYATHIMQRLTQNEWVAQLSITNLRRLFMAYNLKTIIENEGFQNIARAIRRATVNAQYRKASGTQVFEIHYGLAQEWKRKVKFQDQFVIALSDFVQKYNAENARHAEQKKERRESISDKDLDEVLELINKNGSELVGMLLLAYGYAKEEKSKEEN
ncbi:hypothetical protein Desku_2975 [Desulfofundulus kuznetsovii DSM 6115]|uniref:Uncharacterized protein n=1 Tax=Desulfofundulus kuznetsovii (strain DSM 6115 / VKM B-1805 / 17) TaxID=760568 RepID=A0AAU8PFQ2_DESK7|nr:hypothetical protein Desku_2975 [Desulfofundulus kuznetsovii DSM 6115]